MKFFKDQYDVIIIGGALAGLASALTLSKKGMDVLVLEQHNLPGGLATSYVRNGFEIEATLHEMMSIGPKEHPFKIRKFLDEMGVDITWLRVPEAYRVILPNSGIDVTVPAGFEKVARAVEARCPGQGEKVMKLLRLCQSVTDSVNIVSVTPMSKPMMLLKHPDLVRTAGYSAMEVLDTFGFSREAIEILSPYWIYVGNPLSTLPFTVFAVLLADYFGGGSYICRGFSHEMSLAMAERAEELGVQIEYRQRVEKILVKDNRVYGVRTRRGDEIHADYVISGAYPHTVYSSMIEPRSEVPEGAARMLNGRKMSLTCFSVAMILDDTPENFNIHSYSVFTGPTMDTEKIWKQLQTLGPYEYLAVICLNMANPKAVPEGYTQLSITSLPRAEPWFEVKAEDYYDVKRKVAKQMIEEYSKILGVNLLDHIVEIETETPMTVARYTGAWNGGIYGFAHNQDDNIVARLAMQEEDRFISGLEFAGAHAISGNGMSPSITNGRKAAKNILDDVAAGEAGK